MYAPWRPRRAIISIFKRPVVSRHRTPIFRFLSRVTGTSTSLPTKNKQPGPQLFLHRHDQVRTEDGTPISRCDFVELKDGDFMKVTNVFQDWRGSAYEMGRIQGLRFRKSEDTFGFSSSGPNDLYLNLYMSVLSGKSEVTVSDITRKRNMILRNSPFHRKKISKAKDLNTSSDCKVFRCDWIRVYYIKDAYFKSRKVKEGHNPDELFSFSGSHIERFAALHFDPEMDLVDIETALRDGSIPGAWQLSSKNTRYYDEHTARALVEDVFLSSALGALSIDDKRGLQEASGNSGKLVSFSKDDVDPEYTFGDLFCGCGGASRGAAMAGLHVK